MDMTDVYAFPGSSADRIALVLNSWAFITPARRRRRTFDPNLLYQFKVDNTGDAKEDRVIQVLFKGTGASQTVEVRGPIAPPVVGAMNNRVADVAPVVSGPINQVLGSSTGVQVFAGVREDPFFIDLEQFFRIVPDRKPSTGPLSLLPDAATASRSASTAPPSTSSKGFNVLSIIIELPDVAADARRQREDRPLGHDQPLTLMSITSHCLEDILMSKDHQARRAGRVLRYALGGVLLAAAVACGDNGYQHHRADSDDDAHLQPGQRLGNPLVSEVFLAKKDHPFHGSIGPADDAAAFTASVKGSSRRSVRRRRDFRRRSPAALLPDMLIVQTDKARIDRGLAELGAGERLWRSQADRRRRRHRALGDLQRSARPDAVRLQTVHASAVHRQRRLARDVRRDVPVPRRAEVDPVAQLVSAAAPHRRNCLATSSRVARRQALVGR